VGLANGSSKNFNFSCTNVTATTITMQASGISADLSTITFTLNQRRSRHHERTQRMDSEQRRLLGA
jgi:hypothetical protein